MAANVEIKARIDDLDELVARATALAEGPKTIINQWDTFFACTNGRLKLRDFRDGTAELIHYLRADASGPCESTYTRTAVADAAGLREALAGALGVVGEVEKRRTLYLTGQTRIHVDEVVGLGNYLELEVVLEPGQRAEHGAAIAERLMVTLGVSAETLEARAYVDLLQDTAG